MIKKYYFIISCLIFPLYSFVPVSSEDNYFSAEFSAGAMHYLYNEPGVMQIKSILPTAQVSLAYTNGLSLAGSVLIGYNKFGSYSGSLVDLETNKSTPITLHSRDLLTDIRTMAGNSTRLLDVIINSYIGFGFYNLSNRLDSSFSYAREQDYLYNIVNLGFAYILNRYALKLDLSYKYIIYAQNKTKLTDIGFLNDVNFTNQKGYGLEGSIEFGRELYDTFYSLRLSYIYWSVGSSEARKSFHNEKVYTLVEPANYTSAVKLELGIGF